MKSASIRDLHIRTSELVREASEGRVIVIERRGEPVAELRPISKKSVKPRPPDLSDLWKRFPAVPGDSGRFLEEDR
jgi:prevent-host-death family protein